MQPKNKPCKCFDVNGNQILTQNINNTTSIDASTLYQGFYILAIKTANSLINKKLVIVR